jgi:hypothetical protein
MSQTIAEPVAKPIDNAVVKENLLLVLETARTDYDNVTFKVKTGQNTTLHNYLWLSTTILAAVAAIFLRWHEIAVADRWLAVTAHVFMSAAFCAAFAALLFGIDTMRGRVNVRHLIRGTYSELIEDAESELCADVISMIRHMILSLEKSLDVHRKFTHERGLRLRKLSKMLLFAASTGGVALVLLVYVMLTA